MISHKKSLPALGAGYMYGIDMEAANNIHICVLQQQLLVSSSRLAIDALQQAV